MACCQAAHFLVDGSTLTAPEAANHAVGELFPSAEGEALPALSGQDFLDKLPGYVVNRIVKVKIRRSFVHCAFKIHRVRDVSAAK